MPRVKDNGTIVQGLAPNMQTFAQAIEEKFPNVVYTSGKREASQRVGKNYKHSHHNTGNALDISGRNPEVYAYLTKDPEGIALMKRYGLEAIDETNPETMKKTGATGPHYHIEIGPGSHTHEDEQPQQQQQSFEPLNNYDPFKVVQVANSEGSYVVAEDMQKEAYKQAKEEDSDSRKALAEVREAKKQAVDKVFEQPEEQPQQQQQQQQEEQAYPEFTPVDITRSMTPLESIFEIPEMG